MGEIAKLSAALETEMRAIARQSERPEPRLQTIERLIAACDAIEDLSGSDLIARQRGERAPRHGYPILPTNIDHYVRGRSLKSSEWTGPVRVTIQRDNHYRGYANARENERIKPKKVAKAGLRATQIDLALQSVLPVENRLLLIEEIGLGKKAIREVQLIKQGLSEILNRTGFAGGCLVYVMRPWPVVPVPRRSLPRLRPGVCCRWVRAVGGY
mgnify:CR=1 FL=1